jgi:hypothetical protein
MVVVVVVRGLRGRGLLVVVVVVVMVREWNQLRFMLQFLLLLREVCERGLGCSAPGWFWPRQLTRRR